MREEDKARGLLGLCARAGQIAFGEDGCLGAIRTGKCGLLILDQGASANARKRYTDACRYYRVPLATAAAGLGGLGVEASATNYDEDSDGWLRQVAGRLRTADVFERAVEAFDE